MTADFVTVTDAIITDLQANVTGLAGVQVHRYTPWDPQAMVADGFRHLAVWPTGESSGAAEESQYLAQGADEGRQVYVVSVWESAKQESARQVADPVKAAALYQVHNDVRARFYVEANQNLAGSEYVEYLRTRLPDRSSQKRWFRMEIRVTRYLSRV